MHAHSTMAPRASVAVCLQPLNFQMEMKESEAITLSVHRLSKQQDTNSVFVIALMLPSQMSYTFLKEAIILETLVEKKIRKFQGIFRIV